MFWQVYIARGVQRVSGGVGAIDREVELMGEEEIVHWLWHS